MGRTVLIRDLDDSVPWRLDLDDGSLSRESDDMICHGFGRPYPPPFTGAFHYEGTLFFQAGQQRWNVRDIVEVHQRKEGIRKATYEIVLKDASPALVTVRFPARVVWYRVFDLYDEIESWRDDPVKLLPYTDATGWRSSTRDVQAWADDVTQRWRDGV